MNTHLRYRGAVYQRDFYTSTGALENGVAMSQLAQAAQADSLNRAFVILRYRGVLYIRGGFSLEQSDEIRFVIPAVVSKLA